MKLLSFALTLLCCPAAEARQTTISHYHLPGNRMANGRRYTDSRTIFASRQYPLGTRLRVTLNGRSVVGVVEDVIAKRYSDRLDVNEKGRKILGFRGLARAKVAVISTAKRGK